MPRVANDADDLQSGGLFLLGSVEENVFADRVAAVEEFSDKRLIHHHNWQ